MSRFEVEADAGRAFPVLKQGGIAILPNDVGYSLIGGSAAALKRIFETKARAATKLNAMLGNDELTRELHLLTPRQRDMVAALTLDHGLPLGLIAPARADHPLLCRLEPKAWEASSKAGTVFMLLNARASHQAICPL